MIIVVGETDNIKIVPRSPTRFARRAENHISPDELRTDFMQACEDARVLAAETLATAELDVNDSFQLIAAVAALHGHSNLALLLESSLDFYCPECGKAIVFGEEEC